MIFMCSPYVLEKRDGCCDSLFHIIVQPLGFLHRLLYSAALKVWSKPFVSLFYCVSLKKYCSPSPTVACSKTISLFGALPGNGPSWDQSRLCLGGRTFILSANATNTVNVAAVYGNNKILRAMLKNSNEMYVLTRESFLFKDYKLRNDTRERIFFLPVCSFAGIPNANHFDTCFG